MVDFTTGELKFPNGIDPVIKEAKEKFGVEHVGVWHALQGYWQGADPKEPFSERYNIKNCPVESKEFVGWPEQFVAKRLTRVSTQISYQRALQGSTSVHFGGAMLHCMCNVTDILPILSTSNLWRNSQDFFPRESDAFQANFVTWNAYNNILSAPFALPDWDMFQTAICGGSVYISDAPGKHDFELLKRLCLPNRIVPRWPQPARPTADRLFKITPPAIEPVPSKPPDNYIRRISIGEL